MAATLRLTQWEQDTIRQKAIRINQALVKAGKMPLRDSELLHLILNNVIPFMDVEEGVVVIREEIEPGKMGSEVALELLTSDQKF